ncbi:MAG: hypothetical protein C0502_06150 [Opitutus sp.]|nr:hypothetical protein [Opitutus sp.]
MPSSIKKLIRETDGTSNDGLQQSQREAIVDLLNYCMFADNFVARSEKHMVASTGAALDWDRSISFEVYEGGSIGKARKAKEEAAFRKSFLDSIKQRLSTRQSRELALGLCRDLFVSDSTMAANEATELASIRALLD